MTRPKSKTIFVCDSCGNESPKWEGRCPSCREWNTLAPVRLGGRDTRDRTWVADPAVAVEELRQVSGEQHPRLQVSSAEVNRVLGGGIVPGSVILVAGDPGIGKSTLLLGTVSDVAGTLGQTLYVTGEESMVQVRIRADRLGVSGRRLFLLQSTALDDVMVQLEKLRPVLAVVDSIQTIHDDSLEASAGSMAQIRECTRVLMQWAKARGAPLILTGHVTKGGDIAGPRVLEHMVDVVLYMEGETISSWRLLRAVKNRFGSVNEVGVFEMSDQGLIDVDDPSSAFLAERREGAAGSVVVATLEGSRPLLVEVQALTSPSALPTPRRIATGVDFNRLLLICAVLTRHAGVSLANLDVVVNVTGGLRISEPAVDLGLALAIVSSLRNVPVAPRLAAIGELGLGGEIRGVPQLQRRMAEVARLGLRECLIPPATEHSPQHYPEGLAATPVNTLAEAVAASISQGRRRSEHESGAGTT